MSSIEHIDSVERGPENVASQMVTAESTMLRERFDSLSKTARAVGSFFVLATAAGCASQDEFAHHHEQSLPSGTIDAPTLVIEAKRAPAKYSPEWYADDAPLQTGERFDIERSLNREGKPVSEQYSIEVTGPAEEVTMGTGDDKKTVKRWECRIIDKKTGESRTFMGLSRKKAEATGPLYLEPITEYEKKAIETEKAYKASGMTAPDGDPTGVLRAERRHFEGYGSTVTDNLVAVDEKGRVVQLMESKVTYEDGRVWESIYASSLEEVKRRALERLANKKL